MGARNHEGDTMRLMIVAAGAVALAGCANVPILDRFDRGQSEPVDASAPTPLMPGDGVEGGAAPAGVETAALPPAGDVTAPPRSVTTTAAALDTVSEAEKAEATQIAAAATAAVSGAGPLGETVVSLGDPADGGLWVKTTLVSSDTPGTVTASSGEAVAVTLRPLPGEGGAQISLSALQALGLPLVGLHPVTLARR